MTCLAALPKKSVLVIVLAGLAGLEKGHAAQKPKFDAVPTSEEHVVLIRKGISLHDEGDYDGAIAAYQDVLEANPDDVNALYELAFSYFKKQDYKNCVQTAKRGTEYLSQMQTPFYVTWGSCLDESGKPKKAVKAYRSALRRAPTDHLLHFNLAVTYKNLEKSKQAIRHFKKAIESNPNHASSHIALAEQYIAQGHRIPALLAFARFVILEPDTARSGVALQSLHPILGGQTSQGGDNKITIFMNPDANTDEGDFMSAELMLSIAGAAALLPETGEETPVEETLDRFGTLFRSLGRVDAEKEQSGFAWNHYVPYFAEIEKRGFTQPFVYHTHQIANWDGIKEWIDANGEQTEKFLEWSRTYRGWPDAPGTAE